MTEEEARSSCIVISKKVSAIGLVLLVVQLAGTVWLLSGKYTDIASRVSHNSERITRVEAEISPTRGLVADMRWVKQALERVERKLDKKTD